MTRPTATVLGSFAYWAKADLHTHLSRATAQGVNIDFLADSGAFTAYTTGKQVTIKQYATWLTLHAPLINAAMTLDVIGDPAASARNTRALQDALGSSVYIIPIFHVGSPWAELARWCADHPYVALGGGVAVAGRERAFLQWLVRAHRIAADHGTALHGLGMTKPAYVEPLPFYSTDSSYWVTSSRTGRVALFDEKYGRFKPVLLGTRQVAEDPRLAALVRSYGGDPRAVATPGFGKKSARGEAFRPEKLWAEQAGAEAWIRYAHHLASLRPVLPPPDPVRGSGPKIYLAAGDREELQMIVAATAHAAAARGAA